MNTKVEIKENDKAKRDMIEKELTEAGIVADVWFNSADLDDDYEVTAQKSKFVQVCIIVERVLYGPMFVGTIANHKPVE